MIKNNSSMAENPSQFFNSIPVYPLISLLFSPKKNPKNPKRCTSPTLPLFYLSFLLSFTFLGIFLLSFIPFSDYSVFCSLISPSSPSFSTNSHPSILLASLSSRVLNNNDNDKPRLTSSSIVPLPTHDELIGNLSEAEREFWKQPNGEGYKPCLDFSIGYRKASSKISEEKRRFLMVVVSGGLNQQKNQIVDAVVIARILEAAMVVPVLQVNHIWEDESKFSEIFDEEHFKKTLKADVRVVSTLPSTHLMSRQIIETKMPNDVNPHWIKARFFNQLNEDGVLVLKGFDSKLSKNLPPDLQKLRCKVAFHALRFVAPIQELGNQFAKRMWIEGPFIALHLRLEKDVWVRTGCLTGLGLQYDHVIAKFRESHPEYLTGTLNMTSTQRRNVGLCPLSALEVTRLLKALGAPRSAQIYIAGGKPFGDKKALQPLAAEFSNLVTKESLDRDRELAPYVNKSSALAAIDYIVSLSSDLFLPSHGGNMGRAMQGHRAYVGHRKFIKPNKRAILHFFKDTSISDEELGSIIREMHRKTQGQPDIQSYRRDRDVIAYPVPMCMCKKDTGIFQAFRNSV